MNVMRSPGHYILDAEHHAVEVSFIEWAMWFEDITNRLINYTQITSQIEVSTVFLGLDHRFHGQGPPILFETMIFAAGLPDLDQYQCRYSSYDDAQAGHAAAVRMARAAIGQKITGHN
jgi:hypothetical protein